MKFDWINADFNRHPIEKYMSLPGKILQEKQIDCIAI